MTIVDDRTLARCAFEAVSQNAAGAPETLADVAVGNAITTLRVLGVAVGPEILRTVRNDVALILADPARLARARSMGSRAEGRPVSAAAALAPIAA